MPQSWDMGQILPLPLRRKASGGLDMTKPLMAFCSCLSKALETSLANPGYRQLDVRKSATRGKEFFITLLT